MGAQEFEIFTAIYNRIYLTQIYNNNLHIIKYQTRNYLKLFESAFETV